MTTQGPSYYSYYTSKTVRTLRGLLDAGVVAAGWSSTSSQASTSSAKTSEEGDDDTLRAVGSPAAESSEAHGGRVKRVNGSRKSSRPGIGQLFEEVQEPAAAPVDQLKAHPRHSNESSRRGIFSLDRVLFYTGTASDVYDAGSEERLPLLALCPCNLPTELTDLVVAQLTARLDSHAQEAYMLVVFASPSSPIPVQHLIRYYRGLSPEVRRNAQRLWIVHAGLFTKIAVRLFLNTIVSGKVTRKGKVKVVDSLKALSNDLDLSQIEIPPEVLLHDMRTNGKLSLGNSSIEGIAFGRPLSQVMTTGRLPLPIHQAIQHLGTKDNLRTIGLFRKTPSITLLATLKAAYDASIPVRLQDWPDNAILAGSILKTYLRNMQHPVFPSSLYGMIRNCPVKEEEAAAYVKDELLPALQEQHPDGELVFALLEGILQLLKDVAALKDFNQMDSHNLAVVFLPVLVRSADIRQDAMICTMPRRIDPNQRNSTTKPEETGSLGTIIKLCIERYDEIFPLAHQRESTNDSSSYAITPVTSRSASATSASSTDPSSASGRSNAHRTMRKNGSTLRLLGSPGTIKRMNGKALKSEASRESARGLFARE